MRTSLPARLLFGAITVATIIAPLAACSGTDSADKASAEGHWAKSPDTIVFGAVPDQAGSDSNSKPLEDYLAKKTGYKVEYYPTTDYTSLIAAASAGKIDVMSSGALQYVQAVNKGAQVTPVAATLTSASAKDAGYYSVAIAPASSGINSLADAKGKQVCFVDPNSTSGFLFGLYQLKKAGLAVDPTGADASGKPQFSDFTANFAGAHDKSAQTVEAGQCDAGFAEDSIAEPLIKEGKLKEIGREYVPGGPLSVSKDLPADARTKVTEALQSATVENITAEGVSLTPGFSKNYFGAQKIDEGYYKSIEDLCASTAAAKCQKK